MRKMIPTAAPIPYMMRLTFMDFHIFFSKVNSPAFSYSYAIGSAVLHSSHWYHVKIKLVQ